MESNQGLLVGNSDGALKLMKPDIYGWKYGACPTPGGWTVKRTRRLDINSRWINFGVRVFGTFEEADHCAKEIAGGEFSWVDGEYVNMR